MPRIKVNEEISLYYEVYGNGDPLLLIAGLGYATWMWYRQLPALSCHYKVIAFDNRGTGDSDKPDVPYSIEMMAADAAGLLQELGIRRAHILGVSMGGYIAQAFATRYSAMTGALILACTSHGGPRAVPAPPETIAAMTDIAGLTPEQALLQGMSTAFTPEFMAQNQAEIKKILRWRLDKPTPRYAWTRQFTAVLQADLEAACARINAPTLILSGDADRVVPVENSRMLQEKIPGAVLKVFPGVGHLFFIEQADAFNRAVLDFLAENPLRRGENS